MKKIIILLGLVAILISSCSKKTVTIAISKGAGSESYENYSKWMKYHEPNAECIDLYFKDREEALEIIEKADGLILSGGPDVHPGRYGKAYDTARCSIDLIRDTLEFELIKTAMKKELPILGICRGQQILNVAMGGSLIIDIPEDTDSKVIHQDKDDPNIMHNVKVFENSRLYSIAGVANSMVNSNHHQAIGDLATVFMPSAASDDGLIEAFEYNERDKPFLIAVGWHPERLPRQNPLAYSIGSSFIQAAKEYKATK